MPCGRGGVCVILLDGFICAHEGGSGSSMAQSILPENSTLARQIRTAAGHGALSHAVILSGEGDRAAAARYLAAAYVCRESERPCLRCAACRKVLEDIHPDVRWIADTERRELPVETLRELRRDVYIRPNEGERKVYIFSDCGQLNERDQNVLLKIVEEGPPYAAFLFCAENASVVLQTLRSRCVELKRSRSPGARWSCAACSRAAPPLKRRRIWQSSRAAVSPGSSCRSCSNRSGTSPYRP